MKVIYIAGPYTAPNAWERELNIRDAEEMAMEVAKLGAMPLCPHTNTRFFDGTLSAPFWYEGTLELLRRCDGAIALPKWQRSMGTRREIDEAKKLALPFFLHPRRPLRMVGKMGRHMKIYVASSWRNNHQPDVVKVLRELGHEVYDFKQPRPGDEGFHWSEIDGGWKTWTLSQYAVALDHPVAARGFASDMDALRVADLVVLVLPSGRSASWEYGWWCGAKDKCGIVHSPEAVEPELMYRGSIFTETLSELAAVVEAMKSLGVMR